MPSRSLFAKRSSTSAAGPILVVAAVAAAVAAAIGWALDSGWLAAAGFVAGTAFLGAFAVYLIVSERRRHESAEDELQAQANFLESLVESIGNVSGSLDPDEILKRTCSEAKRLFKASSVNFLSIDERGANGDAGRGLFVPLAVRGEPIGALKVERAEPFHRWDVARATVLADAASRAFENARLLADAREREDERARLTERLITAEQDERRRLSLFLHDGPLQSMSGIALMHDAALAALEDGRHEDAAKVIASALERERDTIRTLRDLSFAIEPLVLRDQGFREAVRALGDQIEGSQRITVMDDVAAGERLTEKAQVAIYQFLREALNQAAQRKPSRIDVSVVELSAGDVAIEVRDDGMGERRRAGIEQMDERVRVLNGRLSVDTRPEGGTLVRVVLPAYAATATE